MTVCSKAGCLWTLAKLGEKYGIVYCEGTVMRNNIKIMRGTGANVIGRCTWKQAQLYLLFMEWLFLQGGIAEDVAFDLHVDALVYDITPI